MYFGVKLYMFRTVPLSIIRSLFTVHSAMSHRFVDSFRAGPRWSCSKVVYRPVWRIQLPSVEWLNSWWWTEELSETCCVSYQNKFVKLVHVVGFIKKKFVIMHGHMNLKFFYRWPASCVYWPDIQQLSTWNSLILRVQISRTRCRDGSPFIMHLVSFKSSYTDLLSLQEFCLIFSVTSLRRSAAFLPFLLWVTGSWHLSTRVPVYTADLFKITSSP